MDDLAAIINIFSLPPQQINKRIRSKKESFLLKHQLFTLIYQKKGQNNFNEIIENITMKQYGFGFDIYHFSKPREFNYILKGIVMVFVTKTDQGSSSPVLFKKMGVGEYFGEKTMYGPNLKFHSAKSVSNTYVLSLKLDTFYKTFSGHFKYQEYREKVEWMRKIWLFQEISRNQIERILLLSKTCQYQKNHKIMKPGEASEFLYVIISGQFTLFNYQKDSPIKFQPFVILGHSQVFSYEDIMDKNQKLTYGAICTSAEGILLKIEKKLFIEIVSDQGIELKRKDSATSIKKKSLSQILITESSNSMPKSLSITGATAPKPKIKRYSLRTEEAVFRPKQQKQIFDVRDSLISKENILKDRKMREYTITKIKEKQSQFHSNVRLSTYTNWSFTNDKELLFNYLMKKERKERTGEKIEESYSQSKNYPVKQLILEKSGAVRNHKRKLKKSHRAARGSYSVPQFRI